MVASTFAATSCETNDDCSGGSRCLNQICVDPKEPPVDAVPPSTVDLKSGPLLTMYGMAYTVLVASGLSGGFGLSLGPFHFNLAGAANHVGIGDYGSGSSSVSARFGIPLRISKESSSNWRAVMPEVGFRHWFGWTNSWTASVSIVGTMVPTQRTVGLYWHFGAGGGMADGVFMPEALIGVGCAFWSPRESGRQLP